ncbi:MAG: protecting protein DprA protein [candidate division TM6 bacterium GW2011_GWF2_32_72]|nr:MAG: protecting protein DprA protein [candidate division TM6 bacterium GW2011_GWF2_32_72]
MNDNLVLLHLSLINNVGPRAIKKLLDQCPCNGLKDFYNFSVQDFCKQFNFTAKLAQTIVDGLSDHELLKKELDLIKKYDIQLIILGSSEYPESLANIYAPPTVLYCKGAKLNSFEKNMAIVGARKATDYGKKLIEKVVPQLIENNWTIVSGGAVGADSMAHAATLRNNGKTIAVLGSGLLKPYPASNLKLFKEIIEKGGSLVSPFPLQMEALSGNFPARNRVIAGLSRGCLVVQAAAKSGARITAKYALEEGRDVFAVPGPIDSELSEGCHLLIQQGAKLLMGPEDILSEYREFVKSEYNDAVVQNTNSIVELGDPIAQKILLSCKEAMSIDDITDLIGIELYEVQNKLFDLQLEGLVEQGLCGKWITLI